jgi:hypothetical protein
LPSTNQDITAVQAELTAKAKEDANKCWGYFPAMKGKSSIDTDLPISAGFADGIPQLEVDGKSLRFNFVRLSLIQQTGTSPFHLDTDAATALTGDTSTLSKRLVWRLLLNLNDKHTRTLSYLDLDSTKIPLLDDGGYLHCDASLVHEGIIRRIVIPPRKGSKASGVLFCASRVLHTGQDDQFGHFVTGFGCEEPDTTSSSV